MPSKIDWSEAVKPLLKKYKGETHPLDYKNTYQLLVMVVLSAQDSDKHINQLAPAFFPNSPTCRPCQSDRRYPHPPHREVRNFGNKIKWLLEIAQTVKKDSAIPMNLKRSPPWG